MILFAILLLILLMLIVFMALLISAIGTVGVIVFGDVIVCIFLIVWILRLIYKKKIKD